MPNVRDRGWLLLEEDRWRHFPTRQCSDLAYLTFMTMPVDQAVAEDRFFLDYHIMGWLSYRAGIKREDNPYDPNQITRDRFHIHPNAGRRYQIWNNGWDASAADMIGDEVL